MQGDDPPVDVVDAGADVDHGRGTGLDRGSSARPLSSRRCNAQTLTCQRARSARRAASQLTPHSGEAVVLPVDWAGGAIPGILTQQADWRLNIDVEAHQRQVQARPPHGREHLGSPEVARSTSANTAPASTASAARARSRDFGIQLRAKQKLKGYYGDVTEKQFKQHLSPRPPRMKGDTGQNLIGLLERGST